MLSVSGRSNYTTSNSKVAKHCNIRYLKDYNRQSMDDGQESTRKMTDQGSGTAAMQTTTILPRNPYINIKEAQTSPRG